MDTCHNEQLIEQMGNLTLAELKLDGTKYELVDCYLDGLFGLTQYFNYGLILSFCLGLGIGMIIYKLENN